MIHLTAADYRIQPWANGRGQTVELARMDDAQGIIWRLSVATVSEDGPFSRFPGVRRSLTVIDGPGFRLVGEGIALRAAPLQPVAFAGDIDISARDVTGPSRDFNVMTRDTLPAPQVWLTTGGVAAGGLLALYALGQARIDGSLVLPGDLILTDTAAHIDGGPVLAARILGLSDAEERLRQPGQQS
ncbi:MAG: HutD/Ves family protein [Gemmobacter sp.]